MLIPILAPATAAVTTPPIPTSNYQYVAFVCGAVTTDTFLVKAYLPDAQAAALAPDINGVLTGLATGAPMRWYPGGPDYVVSKVGTTDTAGLYMITGGDVT